MSRKLMIHCLQIACLQPNIHNPRLLKLILVSITSLLCNYTDLSLPGVYVGTVLIAISGMPIIIIILLKNRWTGSKRPRYVIIILYQ